MFTNVVQCNLHCKIGVLMRALGETQAQEEPMTVLVYVNSSKQVGDAEHIKVFATTEAAGAVPAKRFRRRGLRV